MNAQGLVRELGSVLGIVLDMSSENTCQVVFFNDAVDFEVAEGVHETSDEALFIIANLGASIEDADVLGRLLRANYLGGQTGGATISLSDEGFVLHRELMMPMEYADFEKVVEQFVESLRYWKEWIALPHEEANMGESLGGEEDEEGEEVLIL